MDATQTEVSSVTIPADLYNDLNDPDGDFVPDTLDLEEPEDYLDGFDEASQQVYLGVIVQGPGSPARQRTRQIYRAIGNCLCDWAASITYEEFMNLPVSDRPMTVGFYKLYRKWSSNKEASVEENLDLYIPGLSEGFCELIAHKTTWDRPAYRGLPAVKAYIKDSPSQYPGVYVDLPSGDLSRKNKHESKPYVGSSSRTIEVRCHTHTLTGARQYEDLPNSIKSTHYREICRPGVEANFKVVAQFEDGIRPGHLVNLEGMTMILFDSVYFYPPSKSVFHNQASYALIQDIRGKLVREFDLPVLSWSGLNGAWPLRQGFGSKYQHPEAECKVIGCTEIAKKGTRVLIDSLNPSLGHVCVQCAQWRRLHSGNLPSKAQAEVLCQQRQLYRGRAAVRAANGTQCSSCKRTQDQIMRNKGSKVVNGKAYCRSCGDFVQKNERERTAEEVRVMLIELWGKDLRDAGVPQICGNCGAVEGTPACAKGRFNTTKQGDLLCHPCHAHFVVKKPGHHRPLEDQIRLEFRHSVQAKRDQGIPPICANCAVQETINPKGHDVFRVAKSLDRMLCSPCYSVLYR